MCAKNIDIIFSSINVAGSPAQALRHLSWLGDFALAAHCDGVEYMPVFDKLPGHTSRAIAFAVRSGQLTLNSLHASFRDSGDSDRTHRPVEAKKEDTMRERLLSGPLGRIILPTAMQSAGVMRDIQQRIDARLPVVLYPQERFAQDRKQIADAGGSAHLFQPTDHVAGLVGARSLEEFDHMMCAIRGYGYVLDTYHVRRQYAEDKRGMVSDTTRSVPYIARRTTALHLSLGRTDIPGEDHIPTNTELQDALQGTYQGELRDMLDAVRSDGKVGYTVIEATTESVGNAIGSSATADLQAAYADIADGFREYWGT